MKKNFASKKAEPVPGRVRLIIAGCVLLMAVAIAVGAVTAPKEKEIPVLLADGSVITPPWYITIDGEKVVLVESKTAAEETLQNIIERYQDDENTVLDIEVKEEAETERMKLENGDEPPEILTVAEAEKKITCGNGGQGYLTVLTTEEATVKEPIYFKEKYKAEPDLYVGETKIEKKGKEGSKEVTKKVVKENGKEIEEEILEEEILEAPREQIVLTGTKGYDGYGGGEGSYNDVGLSYDPEGKYNTLRTPVDRVNISSGFGTRWGRLHRGMDFALAQGSSIYAADGGVVYFSGYSGGYGNMLKIDHGNGMQTYYAHCSALLVSNGAEVKKGERIALVGSTGNSTGPHLHFEVIVNRACVNPSEFLDF